MASVSQRYLALIREFPLRPIKSGAELAKARTLLHGLLDASQLTSPEEDYLEVLGNLMEEYEETENSVADLSPSEMLAEAMKAKGVTQTAVAAATGIPVSTISELLSEKRDFNVAHISKLCGYFGLGPAAFIAVPKLEPTRR